MARQSDSLCPFQGVTWQCRLGIQGVEVSIRLKARLG